MVQSVLRVSTRFDGIGEKMQIFKKLIKQSKTIKL